MKEIKDQLDKWAGKLPTNASTSQIEAETRAGEFLVACAHIANWRHVLTDEKIKLSSQQTVAYVTELNKGTAKTVTENKATAEASTGYTNAREDFERIENDLTYLKTYSDIFNNAHIFYRQIAKQDSL